MNVLIVAKTKRGGGACVGGITDCGRSVRLIAVDAAKNERAGLEYEVGDVWEIDSKNDPEIIPPHVENIIVLGARLVRRSTRLVQTIRRFMLPIGGGPDQLFDGVTQATASGGLYIAKRTGVPHCSTMFWQPSRPLELDSSGKRLRYRYATHENGRCLTYVGFQEPLRQIPADTLLRVSLAHWWRPRDRPEEEMRCFVQLSGWYFEAGVEASRPLTPPTSPPAQASSNRPGSATLSRLPSLVHQQALKVLRETFGFTSFLPLQADAITRVLRGEDSLLVMPTGGGKSLCYQLPALLLDGLTVVVSPLVALMQDQVRQLRETGLSAACLNHQVPLDEYTTITDQVRHGRIKLLYLAPETLLRAETLVLLEESRLACVAIDEAHCISEWGHDFRPEYRQLHGVRHRFPQAVCLALTATATPQVRADIRGLLGIPAKGEFVASFNRPNLFLAVQPRRETLTQVLAFLEEHRGQSGIIYCGTRKQADELYVELN